MRCLERAIFCVIVVSSALQAAVAPEDRMLTATRLAIRSEATCQIWRDVLEQEGQINDLVRVVYVPKSGKTYSVRYDVSAQTVGLVLSCNGETVRCVPPLSEILSDELLGGCTFKSRVARGPCTSNFHLKDVDVSDYNKHSFFSNVLRQFLTRYCLTLERRGKASFQDFALALTSDVYKKMIPLWKDFKWSIVDSQDVVQSVAKEERDTTEVFIVIGGAGILGGKLVRNILSWGVEIPQDSLLEYKTAMNDEGSLSHRYPYTKKLWRQSINYASLDMNFLDLWEQLLNFRGFEHVGGMWQWMRAIWSEVSLKGKKAQ